MGLVCVDETWRSLTERESELATNDTTALALIRTHAVLTDIAASVSMRVFACIYCFVVNMPLFF